MDDEEDEIDILGDFDLENLLTRRDRTQASYSLSSNDNYSLPSSDWILENTSPLFNVKSVLTSDQIIYDAPSLFPTADSLDVNSNIWTEKEKTLLERGLDLFGKSHVRLSQYIGTKTSSQVKAYLKNYNTGSLASASSTNSLNTLDDGINDFATVEVVVSSVEIPETSNLPTSYSLSSLSEDSDSYMGSTTSTASESERNIEISRRKPQPPKPRKQLVKKKKPKPPLPPENEEESDDSVDYDNTNIIFKARKLSKYHLMVKSGDQVLPSGEQVIRIKKEETRSDSDIDVLESDEGDSPPPTVKPHRVDVSSFDPSCGMKIKGLVKSKSINQPPEKTQPVEDNNVDVEIDVVADVVNTETKPAHVSTLKTKMITSVSCTPLLNECGCATTNWNASNKKTSSTTKSKTRKKVKSVSGRRPRARPKKTVNRNSTNVGAKPPERRNEYLNRPNLNAPKSFARSNANQLQCPSNTNTTPKRIVFKESDFRTERSKVLCVEDLLQNYDFSNVRCLDEETQLLRIAQLGPMATVSREERRGHSNLLSVEEIDLHRDFFLHNDVFFVKRYLKIRHYILREWNCKKPKYISKTTIRSGLKHCGTFALISRVHSYLEKRGFINT